jgi:hypothetical protein
MKKDKQNKLADVDRCAHVNRVNIHSSIKVGGFSLGRCKNECAPYLTVCWEHAEKETLIMLCKQLIKENGKLEERMKNNE